MTNRVNELLGLSIKGKRMAQGLSQERLAELSGLHRTYIGQLERGKKSPTVNTVFDIAKALKILPSELIKEIEKG